LFVPDPADERQAVHHEHPDVNEHEVEMVAGHFAQTANPVLHFDDLNIFHALKRKRQRLPHRGTVFHDQDSMHHNDAFSLSASKTARSNN
jgi:hypothetical protein